MVLNAPYLSQQPVDDFGLRFSDLKYSATLAATTDTTFTVPGNSPRYKAIIKCSAGVWVAHNAVAAVPVGATFQPTTSELASGAVLCREVKAGDVLHFFCATPAPVSIVLYSLYTNN
jgi:hypothetical protein